MRLARNGQKEGTAERLHVVANESQEAPFTIVDTAAGIVLAQAVLAALGKDGDHTVIKAVLPESLPPIISAWPLDGLSKVPLT